MEILLNFGMYEYIFISAILLICCGVFFALYLKYKRILSQNIFYEKLVEYGGLCYFVFYNNGFECSKQLALLLTLEKGISSSFEDVLSRFNDVDGVLLTNASSGDNISLEIKTKGDVWLRIKSRIFYNDNDEIFARVLYFENITSDKAVFDEISDFGKQKLGESQILQGAIDVIPYPVFIRDENLNIIYCNEYYVKSTGALNKRRAITSKTEPLSGEGVMEARSLSAAVRKSKAMLKRLCKGLGESGYEEKIITEVPFSYEEKLYTLGYFDNENDVNDFDKLGDDVYLKVLDLQNVGFAYFTDDLSIQNYNETFMSLWQFEEDFLKQKPSYVNVLEKLYNKKTMPLSKSFEEMKKNDLEMFKNKGMYVDQIVLSNGAHINRIFINNIKKGIVIIYKDITEELINKKQLASNENNISLSVINNLNEGIAIFGANKTLKIYNDAFVNLWKMDKDFLESSPLVTEVFEHKKNFFTEHGNWHKARESLLSVIDGESIIVELGLNKAYEISGTLLKDGGIMITYNDISDVMIEKNKSLELKQSLDIRNKLLSEFVFETKNSIKKNIAFLNNFNYDLKLEGEKSKMLLSMVEELSKLRDNISSTIDLVNIDASFSYVTPEVVDVKNLMLSVFDFVKARINQKQIDVDFNCPSNIDWITIDEKQIKHLLLFIFDSIITNVYNNAKVIIGISKIRKSDIAEVNQGYLKDELYLVISFDIRGDFIKESFDINNLKQVTNAFGVNNIIVKKILKTFEGFFIEEKNSLKICLPYHK